MILTRRHPLTGAPIEPVGYIAGRPVWPIMGGSVGAPEAPPAPAPSPAPPTPDPPPPPGPQDTPPGTPAPPPAGQLEVADGDDAAALAAKYKPEELAAVLLRLRKENGNARTTKHAAEAQAKTAREEVLNTLKPALVAAGLIEDKDDATDPAKLAAKLEQTTTAAAEKDLTIRTQAIELAVMRNAGHKTITDALGGAGVNADRLLDSRSFAKTVAALDPAAADFGDKIIAAMKDAALADESFRVAGTPAARGGVPLPGGSGEAGRQATPRSLADAVGAHYGT